MVEGIVTRLIEVSEKDALDIINLRNDPSISKFLSSTEKISEEAQVKWIKENKNKKNGFYWTINNKENHVHGTISLYNIFNNKAEFGRYICTNSLLAIESELLLIRFGFINIGLDEIYCRTVIGNRKIWNQHYKFGFNDAGYEQYESKKNALLVQSLTKENFLQFDYSDIETLIQRLS